MRSIFCSALLALCGIGVVAYALDRTCQLRHSYLTLQQVEIQKLQILQQFNKKWLEYACHLDLFPILNSTYGEENINSNKWPLEESESIPWQFPSNLTIVALYPPGSICNGPNLPVVKPVDSQNPDSEKNSPTIQPHPMLSLQWPYPAYVPGNPYLPLPAGYPYPIYPAGYPYPIYPPGLQNPTWPPGDQQPTSPAGNQYPTYRPYPTPPPGQQYPTSPAGSQNPTSPAGSQYPTYRPYPILPPGYPNPSSPSGTPWQIYPPHQESQNPPPEKSSPPCVFNISEILGNQPLIKSNSDDDPHPSARTLPIYPVSYQQLPYPLVPYGAQYVPYAAQYVPYQTFFARTSRLLKYLAGGLSALSYVPNLPEVDPTSEIPKYPTPSELNPGNVHVDPDGRTYVIVECPLTPVPPDPETPPSTETDEKAAVNNDAPQKPVGNDAPAPKKQQETPRSPKAVNGTHLVPLSGRTPTVPVIRLSRRSTWASQKDIAEDAKLKTVELIKKYGYPVETHFVTTADDYILCLHRIPRANAPVILLVHGLMSSSASWVQMGPSNGLAYLLYDQGYDVWLLNTRGNIYSPDHKDPNISPAEYWSFSFHEIGVFDLPATIDKISTITNQTHMQYIGHSQGSTSFFVMCSELPDYCQKVSFMQALSPTVYMENTQSPVLRFLSLFRGKFGIILNLFGGYRISNTNNLISQFRSHICDGRQASEICAVYDFVMCGFGWNEVNTTLTPLVIGHASQGASINQIYHYAQLITSTDFQKFDRGTVLNQKQYEMPIPPSYNLSQVNCKVGLQYAPTDWLSGTEDVQNLATRLPNVVYNYKVDHDGFSHFDYLLSKNVNGLINNRVISSCIENLVF